MFNQKGGVNYHFKEFIFKIACELMLCGSLITAFTGMKYLMKEYIICHYKGVLVYIILPNNIGDGPYDGFYWSESEHRL